MSKLHKEWRLLPEDPDLRERLSEKLNMSKIISQVLINRGIKDEAAAEEFLYGDREKLGDPFLLKDMAKAVERIIAAKNKQEKIVIFGDYDVDGVTSTALLYTTLLRIGVGREQLLCYIPEREKEGYGLNQAALEKLSEDGFSLVVTVDCGISAVSEVRAAAKSMDFIITDHHQPPEALPKAWAIINPKQVDCPYPDKNLAGVGVAFKLCQALSFEVFTSDEPIIDLLDYVAIGTVADIVPLTGENRILVKKGLAELARGQKIGLIKLMAECNLPQEKMDAGKIGFIIAPRLNAAGRVGKADVGVELLVTEDEARAAYLAGFLEQENQKRQELEKKILLAAESTLLEGGFQNDHVFLLAGEDWHPGVIGIVASRLVEKYYRPVVMISIKDNVGKGSCRSISGFDIYKALEKCSDLLLKYGGHRQAAGLSLEPENIEKLREELNAIAESELTEADYQPVLRIDSMVCLEEIDAAFLEQLSCLAPHGMGNPAPVFACRDLVLDDVRTIGQDGRHLKLRVREKHGAKDILAWQMGELAASMQQHATVDVAFVPEFNEWQGRRSIQLRAHDVAVPKQVFSHIKEFADIISVKNIFQDGSVQPDVENALKSLKQGMDIDGRVPNNLLLEDMRSTADKINYLVACLLTGVKTVIYVNTHSEACKLFEVLSKRVPEIKMGIYSGTLTSELLSQTEKWFAEERLEVIIATSLFCTLPKECAVEQVILWSVPVNRPLFARQCLRARLAEKIPKVYLLFGKEDIRAALTGMESDLPDRTLVGYFYLVLKECTVGKMAIVLNNIELAEKLRSRYQVSLSIYGIERALTILEELKLIRLEGEGAVRKIYLEPQPSQKLDITSSFVYNEGIEGKEGFLRFAEEMLNATQDEIRSWILAEN